MHNHLSQTILLAGLVLATATLDAAPPAASPAVRTIEQMQPKMVKIHGAGGFRGMEAYQSGMLISSTGHILTIWSHVLDTDYITAVLNDGRKFDAKLLGADPRLEVAVLKIDADDLPYFDLRAAVDAKPGTRVLALSNLFGVATGNEPTSVQHGVVSVRTHLAARRGVFETAYRGPVYALDAMTNNPGAAGGALVTRRGELVGVLGKELRNSLNNTWLNYAIPIAELRESVEQIRAGKFRPTTDPGLDKPAHPITLAKVGIVMIPDFLHRTPPYIDRVRADSPAAKAGIRPDDLVLLVGDQLIQSCKALDDALQYIDEDQSLKLTILRDQELKEYSLRAPSR